YRAITCSATHLMLFFLEYTATSVIYTLSLHDALPIYSVTWIPTSTEIEDMYNSTPNANSAISKIEVDTYYKDTQIRSTTTKTGVDRKSTRLNSSHVKISYAVFCLKKKKSIRKPDISTA